MKTVAIETANLPELIRELCPGQEIVLTNQARPVAKLVSMHGENPTASAEDLRKRQEALDALRELGGLRDVIPDPAEWQRSIRQDRPLPLD